MKKKPRKEPEFTPEPAPASAEVKEALELLQGILDTIERVTENGRISASGEDYFESVSERATSICATIERTNHVSDKQKAALENMLEGVRKWDHSD